MEIFITDEKPKRNSKTEEYHHGNENSLEGLKSRSEQPEEKTCEREGRTVEILLWEQKEKI